MTCSRLVADRKYLRHPFWLSNMLTRGQKGLSGYRMLRVLVDWAEFLFKSPKSIRIWMWLKVRLLSICSRPHCRCQIGQLVPDDSHVIRMAMVVEQDGAYLVGRNQDREHLSRSFFWALWSQRKSRLGVIRDDWFFCLFLKKKKEIDLTRPNLPYMFWERGVHMHFISQGMRPETSTVVTTQRPLFCPLFGIRSP